MSFPLIITIDGPAGAGKSSVAKKVAASLKMAYLDTGAMYRALTLKAMRSEYNLANIEQLIALAKQTEIQLKFINESLKVYLDGEDVSTDIRTVEVTNQTHHIANVPEIREIMVKWQRQTGQERGLVGEGRDLGTVVFPNSQFKFYLDADIEVRVERRVKELIEKGLEFDQEALTEEISQRDERDKSRVVGGLKVAEGAIVIDSTKHSVEDSVQAIVSYVKEHNGSV
jgi:cytidylate kinase